MTEAIRDFQIDHEARQVEALEAWAQELVEKGAPVPSAAKSFLAGYSAAVAEHQKGRGQG